MIDEFVKLLLLVATRSCAINWQYQGLSLGCDFDRQKGGVFVRARIARFDVNDPSRDVICLPRL